MKRWIGCFGKWLALAVLILAAGFCYSCGWREETFSLRQAETVQEPGEYAEADAGAAGNADAGTGAGTDGMSQKSPEPESPAVCLVYVCGEVMQPGVYELQPGQRVYEAIALAGGFTEDAAQAAWNLAEPVYDGMMLEVPDREHAEQYAKGAYAGTESTAARININTASREQLKTLRGIGDARAEDIIRYREEHGAFGQIEDIMKVPGIKDSAFEKIKDEISVGP